MTNVKLVIEESPSRFDVLKTWFLRAVVALFFVCVGTSKFAAHSQWVRIFQLIGFGQWFRYLTGTLQVAGGLLVLIPRTFVFGILILACTMAGAMAAWMFFLGSPFTAVIPGVLLVGLVLVGGEDFMNLIFRRE
jgi:putative oxidoreductase